MLNSFFTWIKTYTPFPASTTPFERFTQQKTVTEPSPSDTPLPWAQRETTPAGEETPQENPVDGDGLVFDLSEPAPAPPPEPSDKLRRRSTKQAQHAEEGETI